MILRLSSRTLVLLAVFWPLVAYPCPLTVPPALGTLQAVPGLDSGLHPVVLIHGNGSESESKGNCALWGPLFDWAGEPEQLGFREQYSLYLFRHDSSKAIGFDGGGNAADFAAAIDASGNLSEVPLAIVAHSRGGLVARSYMNRYDHEVFALITLGTPHRGSPGAVPDWGLQTIRRIFALFPVCVANIVYGNSDEARPVCSIPVNVRIPLGLPGAFPYSVPVRVTVDSLESSARFNVNRLGSQDLAWDGFGGLTPGIPYDQFEIPDPTASRMDEGQVELGSLHTLSELDANKRSSQTPVDDVEDSDLHQIARDVSLWNLNLEEQYGNRLFAYGGYLTDPISLTTVYDILTSGSIHEHGGLSVANLIMAEMVSRTGFYAYAANDGLVPIQSALFLVEGSGVLYDVEGSLARKPKISNLAIDLTLAREQTLARRVRVFRDLDHLGLIDTSGDAGGVFEAIAADLAEGVEVILPTLTQSQPPTAGFSMSSGSFYATDEQILNLTIDPGTGASVTFDGRPPLSSDPDGTIEHYEWRLNGVTTSTSGIFSISLGSGSYTVSLVVQDNEGLSSPAVDAQIAITEADFSILGVRPDPVVGSDELVTLSMSFPSTLYAVEGSTVTWENPASGFSKTYPLVTASRSRLIASVDAPNEDGEWRVQVTNPNGSQSAWHPVEVIEGVQLVLESTLDGAPWVGPVNFDLFYESTYGIGGSGGCSVGYVCEGRLPGRYWVTYRSGGPDGATLAEIEPADAQFAGKGEKLTFRFAFVSEPPEGDRVSVFTDASSFRAAVTLRPLPFPSWSSLAVVQAFGEPETGCADEIRLGQSRLTAPEATPAIGLARPICIEGLQSIAGNSWNPQPSSPVIAANGEDDYELILDTPATAVGFELVTNSVAVETITLRDLNGAVIAVIGDEDLGTNPNSFSFIGFQSSTPIKSAYLDTTGGAASNEGLLAVYTGHSSLPLDAGLVSWWDFENVEGGVVEDVSGNDHPGTLLGSPAVVASSINGGGAAVEFAPGDAVVVPSDVDLLPARHSYSLSAWFKTSATGPQAIVWPQRVCCGEAVGLIIDPFGTSTGELNFFWNHTRIPSGISVSDGAWHHVVGVLSARNMFLLYLDGILVRTQRFFDEKNFSGNNWRSDVPVDTTLPFAVGHRPTDNTDEAFFNGLIDEVKVFNRDLSEQEVLVMFERERP